MACNDTWWVGNRLVRLASPGLSLLLCLSLCLCRHILIGTSVTLTLLINILDMFHMLQQSVQKSKCYLRYAAYPYKTVNFFDQPRQMYFLLICFTAIGVFLGYTYGQISSKEIDSFAGAASTFNPWAPMVPYLTQLLPISCTIGGLATGFAAYMG